MKHGILIISALISFFLICGCVNNTASNTTNNSASNIANPPNGMISSDKYVAVLEEYAKTSVLIGNTTYPPVQPMPIPTPGPVFNYNLSQGMSGYLHNYHVNVNDSFKILLGKISSVNTPTEAGYAYPNYALTGVYTLPYAIENVFTIMNISQNGTIAATYDNSVIYLRPGDNWTSVISRENTTGYYLANTQNKTISEYFMNPTQLPWPVTNEVSIKITNEGIFDKSVLKS